MIGNSFLDKMHDWKYFKTYNNSKIAINKYNEH